MTLFAFFLVPLLVIHFQVERPPQAAQHELD